MSVSRERDPLWLGYRAERARRKADEAEAEAQALEDVFWSAIREMNDRFEQHIKEKVRA